MSSSIWKLQVKEFSSTYPVYPFDFRGHGKSSQHYGPFTIDQFTEDLEKKRNIDNLHRPVLIGWSMGAMVAMQYASRYPERLSALILVSTTPCFIRKKDYPHGQPPTTIQRLEQKLKRDYHHAIRDFCERLFTSGEEIDNNAMKNIRTLLYGPDFPPMPEVALQTLHELKLWDGRKYLQTICVPTLIIHGTIDKIVTVYSAEFMSKKIRNAQLVLLKDVGHAPFLTQNYNFNTAMNKFLSTIDTDDTTNE